MSNNRHILFALVLLACLSSAASAATFVVTNTNNNGTGSLRDALTAANSSAGADIINFNIPGAGPHTITLASALPNIVDTVSIDGYSQPGAAQNTAAIATNAQLRIELRSGGPIANGLFFLVGSDNSKVYGLTISGFSTAQINATACNDCIFAGNFIGTNVAGTTAMGAGTGIHVASDRVRIGGATRPDRNLISGLVTGISVTGSDAVIQGNLIGTSGSLSAAVPNAVGMVLGATNPSVLTERITVGGRNAGSLSPRNFIAGNTQDGIRIVSGERFRILGNFIGIAGLSPMGNGGNGVAIRSGRYHDVGDPVNGNENFILFNGRAGVLIEAGFGAAQQPQGNLVVNNNIARNTGLAIDLSLGVQGDGVTPNDPLDADEGPNDLQNFPVLTGVSYTATETRIRGRIASTPNRGVTIDVYTGSNCHESGYGDSGSLAGRVIDLVLDSKGEATFEVVIPEIVDDDFATATATTFDDLATSEFSPCLRLGDEIFADGFE